MTKKRVMPRASGDETREDRLARIARITAESALKVSEGIDGLVNSKARIGVGFLAEEVTIRGWDIKRPENQQECSSERLMVDVQTERSGVQEIGVFLDKKGGDQKTHLEARIPKGNSPDLVKKLNAVLEKIPAES